MRRYIRHPSDIPIRFGLHGEANVGDSLRDVGFGGLCFASHLYLAIGQEIELQIDKVAPPFQARGRVVWCRDEGPHFVVGVEFLDADQAFRVRMVEQVCHIEHYRREVFQAEGRQLSGEQAAQEWIARYAADFPAQEANGKDSVPLH